MKKRPCTPEQLRRLISYNAETGALTWLRRGPEWFVGCKNPDMSVRSWNAKHAGKPALNVPNNGYRQGWLLGRIMAKAHHAAWALHYGEWPTEQIDHINRKRDDNRICNLRLASASDNSANRPTGGLLPKGVCARPNGKWMARIKKHGKSRYLGQFDTAEDAARAYQDAASQVHGEFAL